MYVYIFPKTALKIIYYNAPRHILAHSHFFTSGCAWVSITFDLCVIVSSYFSRPGITSRLAGSWGITNMLFLGAASMFHIARS